MSFHVGDRWADQHGDEWFIYGVRDNMPSAFCQALAVSHQFHNDGWSVHTKRFIKLTRLISSDRWIPFAEMMPEVEADARILVLYLKDDYIQALEAHFPDWEDTSGATLCELLSETEFTHWRYLTPPEAT